MITIDAFNLQPNLVTTDARGDDLVIGTAIERDHDTETVTYAAWDEDGRIHVLRAHFCDQVEIAGTTVDFEHDNIAYFSTPLAVAAC